MRIKLAILERDINYIDRIRSVFNMRFADKIEILSYTDAKTALAALEKYKVDVFLAGDEYEISMEDIPKRCGFAYFVEEPSLERLRGQETVCKFQQAEIMYKQILNLYAEKFQGVIGKIGDAKTVILWFASAGGGCGSSSAAAAAAVHFARNQKKVLYLELDEFGDAGLFFHGNGQTDMDDLIIAAKSKKKNIQLKLESSVRRDEQYGVCFFAAPPLALDINEIVEEDIAFLMEEIRKSGIYDIVIVDRKLSLGALGRQLWKEANRVVLVTDGSETGNCHLNRAIEGMKTLAGQSEDYWMEKLLLLYNRFDRNTGCMLNREDISAMGSIPYYERATTAQVLQNASLLPLFDNVM